MPHYDTPLGKKTKKSSASYASSLDVDKETNPRPIQVTLLVRKGVKDDLPGLPIGEKPLESTLMVDSDPLMRFVPLKELSLIGE